MSTVQLDSPSNSSEASLSIAAFECASHAFAGADGLLGVRILVRQAKSWDMGHDRHTSGLVPAWPRAGVACEGVWTWLVVLGGRLWLTCSAGYHPAN
jgi:hypothetical protein